jgi:hypothetical protein
MLKHRLHHCLPHVLLPESLDGHGTSVGSRECLAVGALEPHNVKLVSDAKFVLKVLLDHVEQVVPSGDVRELDHTGEFVVPLNVESKLDVCQCFVCAGLNGDVWRLCGVSSETKLPCSGVKRRTLNVALCAELVMFLSRGAERL